ncbi:MAG: class I SAM-dependent methyltransferase [Clostridia bacterium]|nr:class I SAM-dependent methyltransferase [Clostridia bacterium]
MNEVINHYDQLIEENNDPVHDPKPLRDYMDQWDGVKFIDAMDLDQGKSVLEIGVGTGRLAQKTAPNCKEFCGIDISPKTIVRAAENLSSFSNVNLICDDFLSYAFSMKFDVIYSSLTFMHIKEKQSAIDKVSSLLRKRGVFVLSIDKNQSEEIDMGNRKIKIYPDTPERIKQTISKANLSLTDEFETEFAHILVAKKASLV